MVKRFAKTEAPPDLWGAPCISQADADAVARFIPHDRPPDLHGVALFTNEEASEIATLAMFLLGRIGR